MHNSYNNAGNAKLREKQKQKQQQETEEIKW